MTKSSVAAIADINMDGLNSFRTCNQPDANKDYSIY